MTYNWVEYFDLALVLKDKRLDSGVPDAALRSAISRAYYASYCSARKYVAPRVRFSLKGSSAHKDVVDYFINEGTRSGDTSQIHLGRTLRNLRLQRNQADYEDCMFRLPDETQKAINRAKVILRQLQKLGWSP